MTKKLGFLFLCKNDINKLEIWESFFMNNYDKCNIYIHCSEPETITQDFIKKYLVDKVIPSKWGNIYPPIKYLQECSFKNNDYKMILVSESTIPVKSFDYIYNFLTKDNSSYMSYTPHLVRNNWDIDTNKTQLERFINNMRTYKKFAYHIDIKHWYFNECWSILNNYHTGLIVKDTYYYQHMKHGFAWDENYPSYILSVNNELDNIINYETTFVNWKEKTYNKTGGCSPKLYTMVQYPEIKEFKNPNTLFARKFAKESNIDSFIPELFSI